jgi:hypothetical protein
MTMCMICQKRKAIIPDRNSMSRRNKLCESCHQERLKRDLENILISNQRKRNP